MAKLTITSRDKVLKEVDINKTIFIGREKGDIVIKNPAVSARHMKIEKVGLRYIVHDLNSTNGTFVNNQQVDTKELRAGDVISIGRFKFKFDNPDEEPETMDVFEEEDDVGGMTMMIDSGKLQEIMTSAPPEGHQQDGAGAQDKDDDKARLFLYQSSGAPKALTLTKETTLIGSSDNSDIQIKGITIGRVAASITRKQEGYEISYQGGLARLKVNSKAIDKRALSNGDKFSISSYNFEFRTKL